MTVGKTEEPSERQRKEGSEGEMKKPLSITALSTIAVQTGQTQVVVSVLKSGSSVHLQLVHVQPGLCEIGSDREDNQTLLQEQKQLLEKLQKHEDEVLLSVQKKRAEQCRRRQDGWRCEERSAQEEEEEEGVYRAMEKSLREGWTLLLRLMDRRLHALTLAADFYHTVQEFSAGIERLGNVEVTAERLSNAQVIYTSVRRDLLGKSLQLLSISSDLSKKLKELQKTEALQRRGHVLQEEEVDPEDSQCSWGLLLKLEKMVEALQERRRAVDQEVKLQIQQVQEETPRCEQRSESCDHWAGEKDDWSSSLDRIMEQNPPPLPETELDLKLKLVNTKIPPEIPTISSNQTEPEKEKSASLSDLVSISSTQTSASNLAEEDELRVESRMGERGPSPKCFDAVQEAVNENTCTKSLESVIEEETQELTGEECIKVEAESGNKLDNGSNDIDGHLGIRLDRQAEDLQTPEMLKSTNNAPKNQQLERKCGFLSNKLPILNLPSIKMHRIMEDLTIFNSNASKDEPGQECKKDTAIGNSSLNFDGSAGCISKEFPIVEKKNYALEAKSECQLPDLGENRIESGLNESLDEKLDLILKKDIVLETRQLPKEDISTSYRQPQAKIEKPSRSLPIFTLVPKKLQPKLQETYDLINIYTNETTSSEEKQKLESEVQFSSIQSNRMPLESTKDFKLVEMEDIKDIAALDNIQIAQEKEVENIAIKKSEELEITATEANAVELDAPSTTKSEHFSERFKRLQSKWHDRSSSSSPDIAPKFESEKTQRNVCNVKNVNIVTESKELSISKDSTKCEETEANISKEDCKTVTNVPSIELPERRAVNETGNIPIVENIIKVESSAVEEYEFQLEHSTAELKRQEAKRILRRDEIHKLQAIFDQLADKVNVWLDGCSSVLSVSSHPGACVSAAQHSLTTHTQLLSEAQAAGGDAESLVQTLDQMRSLCLDSTEDVSMYPELSARAEVILKDLNTVNATIKAKLQLLQPYVDFLQTAEETQVDFEHLKRTYARSPDEEQTAEEAGWQTALQKFFSTQELGNNYKKHLGEMMQVPGLNLQSLSDVVMETIESLKSAKDEAENLHKHCQTQMVKLREQKEYCLKYRQRLGKTVADLQSVSELLDSCTAVDLGSEQNTSRLQQQFILARPHFTKLDAEADFITTNFETVRGLQQRHELRIREKVTEEDVSALLDLHLRLKQKIEESVSILELSSSLHLIHKQLDERLQSTPEAPGLPGCAEEKLNLLKEQKEQIHNLFNRASNLKMDICDGTRNSSVAGFRVEQLESSLQFVDSQCVAWLKAAARSEETLLREMKTHSLLQDIHQLRDSFKDLKKRFSNLKFNYLKRNDRRNNKAVRNQLQQVDVHEDKLQSLVSRLQTLIARVHVEVKEWGGSRELEDPLNELHRQMGECERSLREHRKTLDMTCTLQEAMEEYQFWCEEASGTISRVGKFSSECRSPEAVSALYRQFEKFVWPTVPQQEERISQITELATRLHGAEEGKRYIEKTVSKHSEMVTAIKKLSDGLLELEEKLKLESLKQQKDEEEVIRLANQAESIRKDAEVKQTKDQETLKPKEQVDNRIAQEAAEMYELKETGHTPELTNKHDGKEIPVRRHSFNKKPPFAKKHTQTDGQATSSFCSTHMFSLSCSPLESNRQVYAIISQSQPALPTQTLPYPGEAKMLEKSTAADVLLDTELHAHPEVLSEDSLSTDEYECPSPDDISLPPLAETPESVLIPSDAEEAVCFSSHYSHRSRTLSERRDSSEANVPSTNRVRTESDTFVPSPLTIQIPTQIQAEFTTMTEENCITPAQAISFVSNNITALASRPADSIPLVQTRKDKNSPQNVTFTILNNHISDESQKLQPDNYLPKSFPVCQSSLHQETTCLEVKLRSHTNKSENCPKGQSGNILEGIESQSTQQECNIFPADLLISKENTFPYDVKISANSSSTDTETKAEVSLGCCSTAVMKETLYSQSSMTSTTLVQGVIKPASETSLSATPSLHQSIVEDLKLPGISGRDVLGLQQQSMECKDELKSQNDQSKEATTSENVAINFARPSQFITTTQESDSISHLNPSSNTTANTEPNQTVDSFHETSTQQCVHDSRFSAQLGATPLPEAKAQALVQPANTHVTPSFTYHQLLTPDQDPDICQPCTIREEITLTPQIKGPSMRPHGQDGSCFTKPVSKATVLEGSPVMLVVEVTGQPEPTLTWCKDDRVEDTLTGNQSCAEGRVLDGALCEAWLTAEDKLLHKINTDGEDGGLMDDFYDIITSDWHTWFGTLCFVLWLMILIVV